MKWCFFFFVVVVVVCLFVVLFFAFFIARPWVIKFTPVCCHRKQIPTVTGI